MSNASHLLPKLILGLLVAALCFTLSNNVTKAHLSFDSLIYQYSFGSCLNSPMGDGDWLNLVFVGARNQAEVQRLLTRHLDWRTGLGGSIACFRDHGTLEPEDGSMASHGAFQERWHLRLNKSRDSGDFLAAVHYDECNPYGGAGSICMMGHDGQAFEQARDLVASALSQANKRVDCGGLTFRGTQVACPSGTVAYIQVR